MDTVKPDLLPLLAEQFHIDGDEGWLLTQTEQQRRDLIKQSIELHRHKGTPWALREVFRILGVTVELEEWWQRRPPAAPYTFELTAWANDNLLPGQALLNPDLYRRLRRMVELAAGAQHLPLQAGRAFQRPSGPGLGRSGARADPPQRRSGADAAGAAAAVGPFIRRANL